MSESLFLERLAIIQGQTTYRQPIGGVGTKVHHIPQAHCLLVTLCGSRGTPWSPGPELAYSRVTGTEHKRERVVDWLETVFCFGDPAATNRAKAREIAELAYDCMLYGRPAPPELPQHKRKAVGFGASLLSQSMDETLRRCERSMGIEA